MSQLYHVTTKGHLKDGSVEKSKYIMIAESRADVADKVAYYVDLSEYTTHNIVKIDRIKPNFYTLRCTVYEPEISETSQVRKEGSQEKSAGHTESPTLQNTGRNLFAFGLVGHITGKDEKSIMHTLGNFLLRKSQGSNISLPFAANGHFIVEELGEADSTRMSNIAKHDPYLLHGKPLSAGGCSPR